MKKAASSKMAQQAAKQALNKGLALAANSKNSLVSGAASLAGNAVNGAGIFNTALNIGKKCSIQNSSRFGEANFFERKFNGYK